MLKTVASIENTTISSCKLQSRIHPVRASSRTMQGIETQCWLHESIILA